MSWPMVPIGEFCDVLSGATPKTHVADYWDGDVYWATPKDLSVLSGAYLDNTSRAVTGAGTSELCGDGPACRLSPIEFAGPYWPRGDQ